MNYVSEIPQVWTNKMLLNKMLPEIFCLFQEKKHWIHTITMTEIIQEKKTVTIKTSSYYQSNTNTHP